MITTEVKTENIMHALMVDYANYNAWANEQLVEWLSTKPVEMMDVEVPSSFNTIRKTLVHIWQTQAFWLNMLAELEHSDEGEEELSIGDVQEGLKRHSLTMALFIRSLEFPDLENEVSVNTPWFNSRQPRHELIMHAMNHSTYHRGQVVTMGRVLGWTDAPMTDYNFYLLMVRR